MKKIIITTSLVILLFNGFSQTFQKGDLFVAVHHGIVQWRTPAGILIDTLSTGFSTSLNLGMAFDRDQHMYVLNYDADAVSKFNNQGALQGLFGSGYNNPEGIVFDSSGNVYVGNVVSGGIRKFDSTGTFLASFTGGRIDWLDLSSDQSTMLFTQEGTDIKRFDVSLNSSLPDFATGLGGTAYALRIRQNGEVLLANKGNIVRLNSTGSVIQTYDVAGHDHWFAMTLNADSGTFWSADYITSNVYHFDIASGSVLTSFNTGTDSNTVFGLAMLGEYTAATGVFPVKAASAPIDIYPNPGSGIFTLSIRNFTVSRSEIMIYNAVGQEIYHTPVLAIKTVVDFSDFANGIYWLKYSDGKQQFTKKLVISHTN